MNSQNYKILIADNQPIVVHGLQLLLNNLPDFQVVGTTNSGSNIIIQGIITGKIYWMYCFITTLGVLYQHKECGSKTILRVAIDQMVKKKPL